MLLPQIIFQNTLSCGLYSANMRCRGVAVILREPDRPARSRHNARLQSPLVFSEFCPPSINVARKNSQNWRGGGSFRCPKKYGEHQSLSSLPY